MLPNIVEYLYENKNKQSNRTCIHVYHVSSGCVYIYICVCACVCVRKCIYIYIYICVCAYTIMHIHAHVHAWMYVCLICIYIYGYAVHRCTSTCLCKLLASPSPVPAFFDAACSKWLRSKGAKSASLTKTCWRFARFPGCGLGIYPFWD